MPKVTVTRTVDVPDGDYCVDYGSTPQVQMCPMVRSTTQSVGWEDGLGSPGHITSYSCSLFDESLRTCYPHKGFHGLTLKKLAECGGRKPGGEK